MEHNNAPGLRDIVEDLVGLPVGTLERLADRLRRRLRRRGKPAPIDRCQICGEPLDYLRHYAPHLAGYVDLNCIPAIVRHHGYGMVLCWLEDGSAPVPVELSADSRRNTYSRHLADSDAENKPDRVLLVDDADKLDHAALEASWRGLSGGPSAEELVEGARRLARIASGRSVAEPAKTPLENSERRP